MLIKCHAWIIVSINDIEHSLKYLKYRKLKSSVSKEKRGTYSWLVSYYHTYSTFNNQTVKGGRIQNMMQIGEAHCFWPVSFPSANRLESRVHFNMFIILEDKTLQAYRESARDDRTGSVLACPHKLWFQSNLRFKDIPVWTRLADLSEYILAVQISKCNNKSSICPQTDSRWTLRCSHYLEKHNSINQTMTFFLLNLYPNVRWSICGIYQKMGWGAAGSLEI